MKTGTTGKALFTAEKFVKLYKECKNDILQVYDLRARACRKVKKEEARNYWYTKDLSTWFYNEPLNDYLEKRENGMDADKPQRAFPNDGFYGWDYPEIDAVHAEYEEGRLDRAWMDEKDLNYVMRLEKEGQLENKEPNLRAEAPRIFLAILALRNGIDKQTLETNFNKQLEPLEGRYNAANSRWRELDNNLREACVHYWKFCSDVSFFERNDQPEAERVLSEWTLRLQKIRSDVAVVQKEMQKIAAEKHNYEIVTVNDIENDICQRHERLEHDPKNIFEIAIRNTLVELTDSIHDVFDIGHFKQKWEVIVKKEIRQTYWLNDKEYLLEVLWTKSIQNYFNILLEWLITAKVIKHLILDNIELHSCLDKDYVETNKNITALQRLFRIRNDFISLSFNNTNLDDVALMGILSSLQHVLIIKDIAAVECIRLTHNYITTVGLEALKNYIIQDIKNCFIKQHPLVEINCSFNCIFRAQDIYADLYPVRNMLHPNFTINLTGNLLESIDLTKSAPNGLAETVYNNSGSLFKFGFFILSPIREIPSFFAPNKMVTKQSGFIHLACAEGGTWYGHVSICAEALNVYEQLIIIKCDLCSHDGKTATIKIDAFKPERYGKKRITESFKWKSWSATTEQVQSLRDRVKKDQAKATSDMIRYSWSGSGSSGTNCLQWAKDVIKEALGLTELNLSSIPRWAVLEEQAASSWSCILQ